MNKMLVAVFDDEARAGAGLQALRMLHAAGDITLYSTGVMLRDAKGVVSVKDTNDQGPVGTTKGLAVGSLIGLLGGPAGMALGALTGTVAGAIRDLWVSGVSLDFIEEAGQCLQPGKVALVAEIEEEQVMPVDLALHAALGGVFRRIRSEVAEAQFDHDIAAVKCEIKELESEASHASDVVKATLHAKLATARSSLDCAVRHAKHRLAVLMQEADAKAESLGAQLSASQGEVKVRIEDRVKRVTVGYHLRGAKLSKAWSLTKEALTL